MMRLLSLLVGILCWMLFSARALAVQSVIDPKEANRYEQELAPGAKTETRLEVMKNVAFYNSVSAVKVLLNGLSRSFRELESLQKQRTENDQMMRDVIEPQLKKGSSVNYAGLEKAQELHRKLGDAITAEESMVRAYRDAFRTITDVDAIKHLLTLRAKKADRMTMFLIDLFRDIDRVEVTEHLIELLSDKDLGVRIAAGESLSYHPKERVPPQAYGALLNAPEWEARAVGIEALGRIGGPVAIELLIHRTAEEKGRLLTDICSRLEIMTSQTLGKSPLAWMDWWNKHKGSFKSDAIVLTRPIRFENADKTAYWGIHINSLRVVFVIDISGSMRAAVDDYENYNPPQGKSRFELARKEIKAAISALSSDAQFNVIAYNDVVIRWEEKLSFALPDNKRKAFEWIDLLAPAGSTNIFDALEMAFEISSPGVKDKYYGQSADTILFTSDGAPTAGRTTSCDEILAQVREWNKVKKVTVHSIGIGRQVVENFMKALAAENGGECRLVY